tara:strand:- start:340 stop:1194 length:855 start_codon:yes stop_codon:yes gene_type:complete
MKQVRSPKIFQQWTTRIRAKRETIGFVPTMGAFHKGHLSLIRAARKATDRVVVSIFVNPLQFNESKDFKCYPRNLARDLKLARQSGVDMVFVPSVRSLYGKDFQTRVRVHQLTQQLEGRARPGHFEGVATAVTKLLHLAQPHIAYFGEKDAQQARVIQQMVTDLNWNLKIKVLPTIREADGLALSSRNSRLTATQRRDALCLSQALQTGRRLIRYTNSRKPLVLKEMRKVLRKAQRLQPEYIAIVDPVTFEPIERIRGTVRLLISGRVGTVRLIDTMLAKRRSS